MRWGWLLLFLACRSEPAAPPEPIRVGLVASLTGPQAAYGVATHHGLELAVSQLNRQGGVGGRPILVLLVDDQGRPSDAAEAARRLILEEQVHLLVGGVASDSALAIAEVAERTERPFVSPSATAPELTARGRYSFRTCFADPLQAQVMARYAHAELRISKLAVVRDLDSEYSLMLAEAFAAEWEGVLVASVGYDSDDADLSAQLAEVMRQGAEAIYAPGYAAQIERLAKALGAARPLLLGSDGWDHRALSAAALEGSYFTSHFSPEDPRAEVSAFRSAFERDYNELPDGMAALGYDSGRWVAAAVERGGTDPQALAEALASTREFVGVTGALQLDALRNPMKPVVVLRWQGGQRHFVTRVAPK